MKNNSKYITLILISLILFFSPFNSIAEEFSISPMLNKGQKWRIAYYEGGPYANYQRNLLHLVKSFIKLGWIDQTMPIRLTQARLVPLDSTMSVRLRKSSYRSSISLERLFLAHCRNLPLARIAG